MNEKQKEIQIQDLQILKNILSVFRTNGVSAPVSMVNETILFNNTNYELPCAQELIAAGATFDISYGCWTYWISEE